jgi:mannose-6-phosphate isomerase-like protein (cupin superfamily)
VLQGGNQGMGKRVDPPGKAGEEERKSMSAEENGGTRSAQHLSPGEGKALWWVTDLYIAKQVSEDTDGVFTLFEVTAAPQSPPAPHIHHREDETYYVLEGEFEFLDEDRTFRAGAGSLVYLPKDRLHSHRNPTDVPAKALVLYTPAGNIEKFVEETGKPARDPSSLPPPPEEAEIERMVAIAQEKYGFEAPPPPPG